MKKFNKTKDTETLQKQEKITSNLIIIISIIVGILTAVLFLGLLEFVF